MKTVNKNKLKFNNGYITKKKNGNIVEPVGGVSFLINSLEEQYQRALHKKATKIETPDVDAFEFESSFSSPKMEAVTPALDEAIEKSLEIMHDIDKMNNSKKMNEMFDRYKELFEFVSNDEVVVSKDMLPTRIDTKYIGNPLELTIQDLTDKIMFIVTGEEYTSVEPEQE